MFDPHELTGGKKAGKQHIAKTKPESEYDHLGDLLVEEVRTHKKEHHHPRHHHHGKHDPEKLVPLPTSPSTTKSEPTVVTEETSPLPTSLSPTLTPRTKTERRILHDRDTNDHSRRHASQLVPSYGEFVFGQGDPLLQAVIDYTNIVAWNTSKSALFPLGGPSTPPSSKKTKDDLQTSPGAVVDHLIEHDETFVSSPVGMNDIVHLDNGEVLSIPCVPSMMDNDDHHYQPLVQPHIIDPGSPLSKIGMKGMTYLDYHN